MKPAQSPVAGTRPIVQCCMHTNRTINLVLGALSVFLLLGGIASHAHAFFVTATPGPHSSVPGAWNLDFGNSPVDNGGPLNVGLPSGALGGNSYGYSGGALFNFDSSSTLPQGISARPPGSTGNLWSIGTSPVAQSGPGMVTFSTGVRYFGFLWGSPDAYNHVSFFDGNELLGTFDGSAILVPPNGDQTFSAYFNAFAGPGESISSIVFTSTNNAFETDNHAFISAVPEPGTVALLGAALGAFGIVRRRKRASALQARAANFRVV